MSDDDDDNDNDETDEDRAERLKGEALLAEMQALEARLTANRDAMRGALAAFRASNEAAAWSVSEVATREPVIEAEPATEPALHVVTEPASDPSAVETSNNVLFVVMVAMLLLALLLMIVVVTR